MSEPSNKRVAASMLATIGVSSILGLALITFVVEPIAEQLDRLDRIETQIAEMQGSTPEPGP